jgi:hypothetical protein
MSSSRFKKRGLAAAGCIAGVIMAAAACSSSGSSSSGSSNTFNVIVIGRYEAPLFAKDGWLDNLSAQFIPSDPSYDAAGPAAPRREVAVVQRQPVRRAVLRRVIDALLQQGPARELTRQPR